MWRHFRTQTKDITYVPQLKRPLNYKTSRAALLNAIYSENKIVWIQSCVKVNLSEYKAVPINKLSEIHNIEMKFDDLHKALKNCKKVLVSIFLWPSYSNDKSLKIKLSVYYFCSRQKKPISFAGLRKRSCKWRLLLHNCSQRLLLE
jgi:hypothetical protein